MRAFIEGPSVARNSLVFFCGGHAVAIAFCIAGADAHTGVTIKPNEPSRGTGSALSCCQPGLLHGRTKLLSRCVRIHIVRGYPHLPHELEKPTNQNRLKPDPCFLVATTVYLIFRFLLACSFVCLGPAQIEKAAAITPYEAGYVQIRNWD